MNAVPPNVSGTSQRGESASAALIIDVRTKEERDTGFVRDSLHIPFQDILPGVQKIPGVTTSTQILLYCRSGRRSGIAATELSDAGYTNAINLGDMKTASEAIDQLRASGQPGSKYNFISGF